MATISNEINSHLKELTQFLLINELCSEKENDQLPLNYSYQPFNKDKSKQENQNYKAASYINPFFMKASNTESAEESEEKRLKECIKNSKMTENLQILLNNVLELPKLRYQESIKLFQVQTENNNDKESNKKAKKLNFETPEQEKNASKFGKNLQETEFSSDYPHAQSTNDYKLNFSNGKKTLDFNESSFEEEMDIEMNMSARSERSNRENIRNEGQNFNTKDQKNHKKENDIFMRKKKEVSSDLVFLTESEKKAKEEKSFIQNYFQSAKNQVLENCSLNCCEGIFGQEDKVSGHKNKTMQERKGIQLKEDKNVYVKSFKN